jgi:hypothetical protein
MFDDMVKAIIAALQLGGAFFKREKEAVAIVQRDQASAASIEPFWDTEKVAVAFLGVVAFVAVLGLVFTLSTRKIVV